MPRRKLLYPQGVPVENVLGGVLSDREWDAARRYLNNPQATIVNVARETRISPYRLANVVAIVNVEYARNPALRLLGQPNDE